MEENAFTLKFYSDIILHIDDQIVFIILTLLAWCLVQIALDSMLNTPMHANIERRRNVFVPSHTVHKQFVS